MGMHASASVYYGVLLESYDDEPLFSDGEEPTWFDAEDTEGSLEERLAELAGFNEPWSGVCDLAWGRHYRDAFNSWGVKFARGGYEYSDLIMYVVRGSSVDYGTIKLGNFTVPEDASARIRAALQALDLAGRTTDLPCWLLVASYG